MSEQSTTAAGADSAEARPSPGSIIRRTRERAGLSLEDLASQMKLAKGTLDALERDDFEQLKEQVYVRGYYRKCAKVLPIAEGDLISAYEGIVKPKAPPVPSRIMLAGGVLSGARKPGRRRYVVAAILLVFVLGVAVWNSDLGLPPLPTSDVGDAVPAQQPPATQEALPGLPPAALPRAAETPPAASQAIGPSTSATPAATAPAQAPAATARADEGAPATRLVLTFDEPSWVRVEDSRNRTLVIGLIRAGERQVLDGEPPYTVFLGNAARARVEYGGQPVDLKRHVRDNGTARFTVP